MSAATGPATTIQLLLLGEVDLFRAMLYEKCHSLLSFQFIEGITELDVNIYGR